MKEFELVGMLMRGHPDIFSIIQNIREKYQIQEVRPRGDIEVIRLGRNEIG